MKKKKPSNGVSRERSKRSCASSSSLKKQVDDVKKKASAAIDEMATNPDISFEEFLKRWGRTKYAFAIMYAVIELGEKMEKLRDCD